MRRSILASYVLVVLGTGLPGVANATCGEECDSQYSSAIDDCRSQYGDDPADADDLANCVQEARDDYRSCLDDCASAALSLPRGRGLMVLALTAPTRSLCQPSQNATAHCHSTLRPASAPERP